jgi:alpha-1,6-mannosyltransferase
MSRWPSARRLDAPTAVIAAVGFVGSVLIAWASYVVGALPRHHLDPSVATGPYRWPYQIGVGLLVVAWLGLGRRVLDRESPGMLRRVVIAGVAMAIPLLVAAPVTSQDVWGYLAQGHLAASGLDPYAVGPAAAPGPLAHAVARPWVNTPSPYGPLWLWFCRVVVEITGQHPWLGMFVLRLVAAAGLVAFGFALTRLTRALGGRPEVALWLGLCGPFPLLMMVAAVHNEAVMLPLLVGGAAVAATHVRMWRALVLASVVIGAAGAIKVVALVVLPFLPLLWFRYADPARRAVPGSPTFRRWVGTGAVSVAVGVGVVLAIGVVTGLGTGWMHQVGDGRVGGRWFSVPHLAGDLLHLLWPDHVADVPADRYLLIHPIGLVFLVVSLAFVTVTALRRRPESTLALVMLLIVVSSTAPRIWYLLWPLVFAAVIVAEPHPPRRLLVTAVAGAATVALWFPAPVRPQLPEWTLLAFFVPLAVLASWVLRSPEPPGRSPT